MKTKIGIPRDYELNLKEDFANENLNVNVDIPKQIISRYYLSTPEKVCEMNSMSDHNNSTDNDEEKSPN